MNYKLEKILKDNRKYFIIFIAIWIAIEWAVVSPIAVSISSGFKGGKFYPNDAFNVFIKEFGSFTAITKIFQTGTLSVFGRATLIMSIIYLIALIIGFMKSKPKNEFTDIEHGSSDWSEHGEQYKVLSKNKGIILAENNYLPVNKPGNVNVLIVGRIWCR